jgi:hypothetical protein
MARSAEALERFEQHTAVPMLVFPMRDMLRGVVSRVMVEKIYGMGPWRGNTQG